MRVIVVNDAEEMGKRAAKLVVEDRSEEHTSEL